jgi:hypothetical protein
MHFICADDIAKQDLTRWPATSAIVLLLVLLYNAYLIERLVTLSLLPAPVASVLHFLNSASALCAPAVIVWVRRPNEGAGIFVMLAAIVVFMKTTSYAVVCAQERGLDEKERVDKAKAAGYTRVYPENVSISNMVHTHVHVYMSMHVLFMLLLLLVLSHSTCMCVLL